MQVGTCMSSVWHSPCMDAKVLLPYRDVVDAVDATLSRIHVVECAVEDTVSMAQLADDERHHANVKDEQRDFDAKGTNL